MRYLNAIVVTLFTALFLTLLPMPEWAVWARPAWVLLVLIFWTMIAPQQVNVGIAWVTGLMMDTMTGTMLGEHAVALTIVVYFAYRLRMRINMFPMIQQGLSIFLFVLIYQAIIYGLQAACGEAPRSSLFWLSSFTSMLLWPWLFGMLRNYCHRARISLAVN